jgi:hypothetical protein
MMDVVIDDDRLIRRSREMRDEANSKYSKDFRGAGLLLAAQFFCEVGGRKDGGKPVTNYCVNAPSSPKGAPLLNYSI